jgi:acetoin utilization deacetylase AcuC-like enzyme
MLPFPLVYSEDYVVDLGQHVFPAIKYRLVRERLLRENKASAGDFIEPPPIEDDDVLRVHSRDYLEKIKAGTLSDEEVARLEVPFSESLVRGVWSSTGGTLLACQRALERGIAINLSGGYHHAFADHGEGFCLLNDVAIALSSLHGRGAIERSAIVDLDVHHGNGTAAIFASQPQVFTFSMHQQDNYPFFKPPSDIDVGLPDGASGDLYLELLGRHLPEIMDEHQPQLVVYLAGADPYREDRLGGLGLTLEALAERDREVFAQARKKSIPVAVVLAGGYAVETEDTVTIHVGTVEAALQSM